MARVRFVFGRAGSGKTRYCLTSISRSLRRSSLAGSALILLVPEQATYQMERALAERSRRGCGYIRARVVSFRRLAKEVQDALTTPARRTMLTSSRLMVMRHVLAGLRGRLRYWKSCRPRDIAGPILRLIDELIEAGLTTDGICQLGDSFSQGPIDQRVLADKLHDISLVYEAYRLLDLPDLDDGQVYMARYVEGVAQTDWLDGASVYVDGFAGFTGQEYAALAATAAVCDRMYITLCLDPDHLAGPSGPAEWDCFSTVGATYERLVALADDHRIPVGDPIILGEPRRRRFASNHALAGLERCLSQPMATQTPAHGEPVELIAAPDRVSEVKLAAGRIVDLARTGRWRYNDISVVVRDLSAYESVVRDVFDRFEIPYFLDARRPIGRSACGGLARLISGALGAVVYDYRTPLVLRYLKSGLVDIDPDLAAQLENYVLAHGIDGRQWLKRWRGRLDLIGVDDEDRRQDDLDLDDLNRLREQVVGPLRRLEKAMAYDPANGGQYDIDTLVGAVIDFLEELKIDRRLTALCQDVSSAGTVWAQVYRQVWRVLNELFVQLHLSLEGRAISPVEFLETLEASFDEQTVGVVPPCLDQVLVGEIERSRHPSVRATFVLGFNEGQFPTPITDDVMLTDIERRVLCWPDLRRPGDAEDHYAREQYLAYIALTRASEFLWISYADRDIQGHRQYPSRYLMRLSPILGSPVEKSATILDSPVRAADLAGRVVDAIDDGIDDHNADFWTTVANGLIAMPSGCQTLSRYIRSYMDTNRPALSAGLARSLYATRVSFSQLQTYYRCPFQHFVRYGLKLADRPMYRLDPVDLGRFRHEVMRMVWEQVRRSGLRAGPVADDFAERTVAQAVEACRRSMGDHVLFSSARNRYIFERVTDELTVAFKWQLRNFLMGQLAPARLEDKFACQIDDRVELVGRIDRVDSGSAGRKNWSAVFDYKSGAASVDFTAWYAGTELQLAGYMLVLVGFDGPARVNPAAAMFLPLIPARRVVAETADVGSLFRASGLVNCEAIDLLIDRTQSSGREFNFSLGKDNQPIRPHEHGSVVQPGEFRSILHHTANLVRTGAAEIFSGRVVPEPYRKNRQSACSYCEFRSVCRFDPFVARYRTVAAMTKQDVLSALDADER